MFYIEIYRKFIEYPTLQLTQALWNSSTAIRIHSQSGWASTAQIVVRLWFERHGLIVVLEFKWQPHEVADQLSHLSLTTCRRPKMALLRSKVRGVSDKSITMHSAEIEGDGRSIKCWQRHPISHDFVIENIFSNDAATGCWFGQIAWRHIFGITRCCFGQIAWLRQIAPTKQGHIFGQSNGKTNQKQPHHCCHGKFRSLHLTET